jgi:hypothetical protein
MNIKRRAHRDFIGDIGVLPRKPDDRHAARRRKRNQFAANLPARAKYENGSVHFVLSLFRTGFAKPPKTGHRDGIWKHDIEASNPSVRKPRNLKKPQETW